MLAQRHSEAISNIKELFAESGYRLSFTLLNAVDYSVPQDRKRVFFIGIRNDLNFSFEFPKPLKRKKEKDLEAYYEKFPWEKPLTEKEKVRLAKEQEKRDRAWEKRWERQCNRRRYKTYSEEELKKMRQSENSRKAGYEAGKRLNLEPFIENKSVKRETLN